MKRPLCQLMGVASVTSAMMLFGLQAKANNPIDIRDLSPTTRKAIYTEFIDIIESTNLNSREEAPMMKQEKDNTIIALVGTTGFKASTGVFQDRIGGGGYGSTNRLGQTPEPSPQLQDYIVPGVVGVGLVTLLFLKGRLRKGLNNNISH